FPAGRNSRLRSAAPSIVKEIATADSHRKISRPVDSHIRFLCAGSFTVCLGRKNSRQNLAASRRKAKSRGYLLPKNSSPRRCALPKSQWGHSAHIAARGFSLMHIDDLL